MQALMSCGLPELVSMPEVGGVIAESVVSWLEDTRNRQLIHRLESAGLTMCSSPVYRGRHSFGSPPSGRNHMGVDGNFARLDSPAGLRAH